MTVIIQSCLSSSFRDAHLSHLERVVQDLADTNTELKQQKMNYIEKLYSSNRRVTDLESRWACVHVCMHAYV